MLTLPILLSACVAEVPNSICAMPQSRALWQNLKVKWHGMINRSRCPPHGCGDSFRDVRCAAIIKIRWVQEPYPIDERVSLGSSFYATVHGQLLYDNGDIILEIDRLENRSRFMTNEERSAHHREMVAVRNRQQWSPAAEKWLNWQSELHPIVW
jgi:hypothetical protein